MPKVSVIMGVYNSAKTLRKSIDSIIQQSYSEWIFIICDDGSEDETYSILNQYRKKYSDKFIIMTNKHNLGLTATLNKCLKEVKTEYVARMDSDDISSPDRLKKQIEFLDEYQEFGFVGSCADKFDENGIWSYMNMPQYPKLNDFLWNNPFIHPTIVIRKQVLDQVHGYREIVRTNRCEDYDLWFRVYALGLKGYNFQESLLMYYEGQVSYKKRKYIYRINEAMTRFEGYKSLKLMPIGLIFTLKPLVVGLLPQKKIAMYKQKNQS